MTRHTQVIETITCDICGDETTAEGQPTRIGMAGQWWELDLCDNDYNAIGTAFGEWIANARKVKAGARSTGGRSTGRASRTTANDWDYLESKGFTRHRGRLSTAEKEALAHR